MNVILRTAALGAALVGSQQAAALALGEARVGSDMSSPLDVRIPIVDLAGSGIDPGALRVDVPRHHEHATLGAPDPVLPRDLSVALSVTDGGIATVQLSTTSASREPVLRFLLRATWPGGSALREYELIIDPPAIARPRRPLAAAVASAVPGGGFARVPGAAASPLLAPAPAGLPRAGTRYGPVGFDDTLFTIARVAYPALAAQLPRVMDVIAARNAAAFVDGDPDRIMAGATVALPDEASMAAAVRAGAVPAPARTASAAPAADAAVVAASGGGYAVRAGDTLYGIVRRVYGDMAADLPQRVRALFDRNPGAFIDGDADRLRIGAVLDLPGDVVAGTKSARETVTAPAPGAVTVPAPETVTVPVPETVTVPVPETVTVPVPETVTVPVPESVAVAAPETIAAPATAAARPATTAEPLPGGQSLTSQASPSSPAPRIGALQRELAQADQELSRERGVQSDLRARLDGLHQEIEALRARDAELTVRAGALSAALASRGGAMSAGSQTPGGGAVLADAPHAATIAVPDPAPEPASGSAPGPASSGSTAPAPTDAAAARRVPPVVAVSPAQQAADAARLRAASRPSSGPLEFLETLLPGAGPWLAGGLLGLLLLAGALFAIRRRARNAVAPRVRADEEAARRRLAEVREHHDSGRFDAEDIAPKDAEKADNVHLTDAARAGKLAKEAAVHLAYENYDAAKTCIQEAIRLDPHRDEHKMVLVTVYESTGEQARARAIIDDLLTRREQLPNDLRRQVEQLRKQGAD